MRPKNPPKSPIKVETSRAYEHIKAAFKGGLFTYVRCRSSADNNYRGYFGWRRSLEKTHKKEGYCQGVGSNTKVPVGPPQFKSLIKRGLITEVEPGKWTVVTSWADSRISLLMDGD